MDQTGRRRTSAVAALLVLGSLLYLTLPYLAWRWTEIPFPGFFVDPNLVVDDGGSHSWPSKQLSPPITYPQRLVAIDGEEVSRLAEMNGLLLERGAGTDVALSFVWPHNSIVAPGSLFRSRTVTVSLLALSFVEIGIYFWPLYLAGLAVLSAGIWTFRRRPHSGVIQTFALFTLATAWGVGGYFDASTSQHFIRLWVVALPLAAAFQLLLAANFPRPGGSAGRWPRAGWGVLGLAIITATWAEWWLYRQNDPWAYVVPWRVSFSLSLVAIGLALALFTRRALTSESPPVRRLARWLAVANLAASLPLAVWFFTHAFDVRVTLLPVAVYPLALGWAIVRQRHLVPHTCRRRSVTYVALTAILSALIVALALLVRPAAPADNAFSLVLAILGIAFTFTAARTWVQTVVDHYIFREPVRYSALLREYNQGLTRALTVHKVAELMVQYIKLGVPAVEVIVYLPDAQGVNFTPYNDEQGPAVAGESFLVQFMRRDPGAIYPADDQAWPPELLTTQATSMALDAALIVPMVSGDDLLGWVALSAQQTGRHFAEAERDYLNSLAAQALLALERVHVVRHLESRVSELNTLSQFSQALNYTIEYDVLLELVYTYCQRLLGIKDFYIALREPRRQVAYAAFHVENEQRLPEKEQREDLVQQPLVSKVLRTGQPLIMEDESGYCWLLAPLNAGAETLGVLYTHSQRPDERFSERQQQLFGVFADRTATALDRWQVSRELQTRARQLQTINEVTHSLTATVHLDDLLELILAKAMELLDAEAGSFLMVDDDTGELEFRVVKGPAGQELLGTRLSVGTGLAGTAAQSGEPVLVNNVQHDKRWFNGIDASTDFVTQSSLSVPLLRQQQVIGVLQVINKRSGAPYDEDDETLLAAFAGQAVVAVETARLLQQTDEALQARVSELSLLQQLDRDLSTTLELEPVVSVTLNWALRLCEGTAGALVLLGEDETPYLRAYRGYDPSFEPGVLSDDALSGGLVGQVLRTGQPHLTGNVQAEPNYIAAAFETRSQITVPLTFQQRTIGAIAIESDRRDAFGAEDVERAVRLANHAGAAVANALLYEQVIAANEAKSEFVSMVSHELKTPLTAIRGYADLMLSGMTGQITAQQRGFLETIGKNITKTSRLIGDLTDISRLETGVLRIDPAPTSFATVVSEAVQTVQGAYAEKAIELHLVLPVDLPPVMADPDRMVQVMTNLLSNAGKYSPPEAEVIVTVHDQLPENVSRPPEVAGNADTPLIYCAVKDTGFGISEEDQQHLFTKFFRSDDPNVRQAPGTGLGLSITRGIVEMHGGQIWFDSVLSEGTTFHFTLPQAR